MKYQVISLDHKLTWNTHLHKMWEKVIRAFYAYYRIFEKMWRLKTKVFLYTDLLGYSQNYRSERR